MLNVAFLGAGGIAGHHLRRIRQMNRIKIIGIHDVDELRAKSMAEEYSTKAFNNLNDMLDSEPIDAVWICIPPSEHKGQEIEIARRGIHIFIEKPIGLDMVRVEETAAAIRNSGIITSVGYHKRYSDLTDRARRIVKEHPPVFARGAWIGGMPGPLWWRQRCGSGGQIVEQTTHIYDLARYLFGEAKKVHAIAAFGQMSDIEKFDVETASLVNVAFENGTIVNIGSSCILSQGYGENLEVFGRDFHFDLRGGSLVVTEPGHKEEFQSQVDPYAVEDEIFLDSVRTGNPSRIRSTYADGVKSLKLCWAAVKSLTEGREVEVE